MNILDKLLGWFRRQSLFRETLNTSDNLPEDPHGYVADFGKTTPIQSFLREIATEDDFEFIIARCIKEAKDGHFNEAYSSPIFQAGLRQQIACAINDLPYPFEPGNPRNGTGARIVIIEEGGRRVGFLLALEDMPGSWNDRVEIHLLSIVPEARGRGIGRRVVREFVENVKCSQIYARCYATSAAMIHILKTEGFAVVPTTAKRTITLELACCHSVATSKAKRA